MYELIRGNLKTGEKEVIEKSDENLTEKANQLNLDHWRQTFIERTGKIPTDNDPRTVPRRYIWFCDKVE